MPMLLFPPRSFVIKNTFFGIVCDEMNNSWIWCWTVKILEKISGKFSLHFLPETTKRKILWMNLNFLTFHFHSNAHSISSIEAGWKLSYQFVKAFFFGSWKKLVGNFPRHLRISILSSASPRRKHCFISLNLKSFWLFIFMEKFLLFSALKNDELDAGSKNDENHLSQGKRSSADGKVFSSFVSTGLTGRRFSDTIW